MDEINLFITLWWIAGVISVGAFLLSLLRKSWGLMAISLLAFLPIAYYFLGAENGFKVIGLFPIVHLTLIYLIWKKRKKQKGNVVPM